METFEYLEHMDALQLVDADTKEAWFVPQSGEVEIIFAFIPMPQAETMLSNKTQINALMEWCNEEKHKLPVTRGKLIEVFSMDNYVLGHQVQEILDELNAPGTGQGRLGPQEVSNILKCLTPCCIDTHAIEQVRGRSER